MSGLLLGMGRSVCTSWLHNVVTLPPGLVSNNFIAIIIGSTNRIAFQRLADKGTAV